MRHPAPQPRGARLVACVCVSVPGSPWAIWAPGARARPPPQPPPPPPHHAALVRVLRCTTRRSSLHSEACAPPPAGPRSPGMTRRVVHPAPCHFNFPYSVPATHPFSFCHHRVCPPCPIVAAPTPHFPPSGIFCFLMARGSSLFFSPGRDVATASASSCSWPQSPYLRPCVRPPR